VFSSPALASNTASELTSSVNLLVGLEGAVSVNRFQVATSDEGAPYRDFRNLAKTQIVLTVSKYDAAAGGPIFWYDPSGSMRTYKLACLQPNGHYQSMFRCLRASDTSATGGGFEVCNATPSETCVSPTLGSPEPNGRQVWYIDASDGVTQFNTLNTGGQAHSDIYRLPMGRLLWMLIQTIPK